MPSDPLLKMLLPRIATPLAVPEEANAVEGIECDRVAGPGIRRPGQRAADHIVRSSGTDEDAVVGIRERGRARDVSADEIALYLIVGARPEHPNPVSRITRLSCVGAVARDDVARGSGGAANQVVIRVIDLDAAVGVGQRRRSVRVGANQVALHGVVVRAGRHVHAHAERSVGAVAGDQVARARRGAADDIAVGVVVDVDAGGTIRNRGSSCRVGANAVADDGGRRRHHRGRHARIAGQVDAGCAVARYDIACTAANPPMVLFEVSTNIPALRFGNAAVPPAFKPMMLPSTK